MSAKSISLRQDNEGRWWTYAIGDNASSASPSTENEIALWKLVQSGHASLAGEVRELAKGLLDSAHIDERTTHRHWEKHNHVVTTLQNLKP